MPINDSNRTSDRDNAIIEIEDGKGNGKRAEVGTKTTGEDAVHVIAEVDNIDADNYPVVPAKTTIYKHVHLQESGGNQNMDVDGSSTERKFFRAPSVTDEIWYVESVSLLLIDGGTNSANNFGARSTLSNGLEVCASIDGTEYKISECFRNADIVNEWSDEKLMGASSRFLDSNDTFVGVIKFKNPLVLKESQGDEICAKVKDNLTGISTLRMVIKYFKVLT